MPNCELFYCFGCSLWRYGGIHLCRSHCGILDAQILSLFDVNCCFFYIAAANTEILPMNLKGFLMLSYGNNLHISMFQDIMSRVFIKMQFYNKLIEKEWEKCRRMVACADLGFR